MSIANLFVILSQLNLTKAVVECLKSGFKCKKEDMIILFASLEFDLFRV